MTTTTYESPDRETIETAISTGLENNALLTICARIEAEYTGRDAGGYLSRGDCLVIVKPDGTILVHSDEKHRPRNWQTRGTTVFMDTTDADELTINGRQNNPSENLMIVLHNVYSITSYDASKRPSLELEGTEDDMHDYLLDNPNEIEEGFRVEQHEKPETAGRIDIFGYDSDGIPVLVEVKRRQAAQDHVDQLQRYIDHYENQTENETTVRGVLVAPSASDNVKQKLSDRNLEFVSLNPFETPTKHPQNSSLGDF